MNAVLNEPAVIALMSTEQKHLTAKAEELWTRLMAAEEAMKPYKDAYDEVLREWSEAHRLANSIAAVLKANQPAELPQEATA